MSKISKSESIVNSKSAIGWTHKRPRDLQKKSRKLAEEPENSKNMIWINNVYSIDLMHTYVKCELLTFASTSRWGNRNAPTSMTPLLLLFPLELWGVTTLTMTLKKCVGTWMSWGNSPAMPHNISAYLVHTDASYQWRSDIICATYGLMCGYPLSGDVSREKSRPGQHEYIHLLCE
jgi:hypothetical protein